METIDAFQPLANQSERYVERSREGWGGEKQVAIDELNLWDRSYLNLSQRLKQAAVAERATTVSNTAKVRLLAEADNTKKFIGIPFKGMRRGKQHRVMGEQ